MNEYEEQIVFFILLAVMWLVAILSLSLIWIYISNKAPGMQTLYDCLIKDLIVFSIVHLAVVTLVNMDLGGVPPWLAVCLAGLRLWAGLALLTQLLLVTIIRYLSIFHNHVIMELNETKFVKKGRLSVGLFALACTLFELARMNAALWPMLDPLVNGEVNQEEQPVKLYTLITIVTVDIMSMVILQVRVELLNRRSPENEPMVNGSYGMGTIRFVIFCGVLTIVGSAYRSFKSRVRLVLLGSMAFNVIPCIFILRNENMTQYVLTKFFLWVVSVPSFRRRVAPSE